MVYFEENSEAMLQLEAMVDKVGLSNVLYALAHIARMKADHIAINWQDHRLARSWGDDANRIEKTIRTLSR
jgi:hypothetical protein